MNRHDRQAAQRRGGTLEGADVVTELARGFVRLLEAAARFLPLLLRWALTAQRAAGLGVLIVRRVLAVTRARVPRRAWPARVMPMLGVLLVRCCPRTGPPAGYETAVNDCAGGHVSKP